MMHAAVRIVLVVLICLPSMRSAAAAESPVAPAAEATDARPAIIVDTDMGLDDVRAILALLAADVDVHAIVTVEGSAAAGKGTDNLIGLLESVSRYDIPVYRGSTDATHDPPPWRQTANTLGGNPFPPPRRVDPIAATPDKLARMLDQKGERFRYLALGPLSNLAALAREYPKALAPIETIWVPARVGADGLLEGWNLSRAPEDAAAVFALEASVVVIDLSGAEAIDAHKVLSRIGDRTAAARWISRGVDRSASGSPHLFIHDEPAAAALIEPELLETSDERYRASSSGNGRCTLHPHARGNIRIARIPDLERSMTVLRKLWQAPIRETHANHDHGMEHAGGEHEIAVESLLTAFHGHLGPYVVLGYRMGRTALDAARSEGHFGISAEVHSILKPPPSCLIDGIQLGSGCTLGKRNITVHEADGPAFALFTKNDGTTIRIALRPEIPARVTRLVDEIGVEAAGRHFLEMEAEELFEVEIVRQAGDRLLK